LDELIPETNAEVDRWESAIREEVIRLFDGREFAGLQVRADRDDPYTVSVYRNDITVRLDVYDPERGHVGKIVRVFRRDYDGSIVVEHNTLRLSPSAQGRGFAGAWNRFMADWYRYSGVDRIEVHASSTVGGYTWARAGFDWAPNTEHRANAVLDRLRAEMSRLDRDAEDVARWTTGDSTVDMDGLRARYGIEDPDALIAELRRQHEAGQEILDRAVRHPFGIPGYPPPEQSSHAGWDGQRGRDAMWLGKAALLGSDWKGVMPISEGGPFYPRSAHAAGGTHSPPGSAAPDPTRATGGPERDDGDFGPPRGWDGPDGGTPEGPGGRPGGGAPSRPPAAGPPASDPAARTADPGDGFEGRPTVHPDAAIPGQRGDGEAGARDLGSRTPVRSGEDPNALWGGGGSVRGRRSRCWSRRARSRRCRRRWRWSRCWSGMAGCTGRGSSFASRARRGQRWIWRGS